MTTFQDNNIIGGELKKYSLSGFFNYVFNFDNDNKNTIINMVQYVLLGVIPIIVVLKGIKNMVPEEDDTKSTPEITLEVSMQLFAIFFAIWFIDRMIRYIPTYTGSNYHKFNEINFILPLLVILITMQTKLGAKINILIDRFLELWNGSSVYSENKNKNKNKGILKVSQPIVNEMHQMSRADILDNSIIKQPAGQMPMQTNASISMIDALPNMMQSGLNNFQQQAIETSFMDSMEPMPANSALGGVFGSSF